MTKSSNAVSKIRLALKSQKYDFLKKHLLCKQNVLKKSKHPYFPLEFKPYSISFINYKKKSFHLCLFDDPHNHPYCIQNKIKLFTMYLYLKIKKNGSVKRLQNFRCDPRFQKYKFNMYS